MLRTAVAALLLGLVVSLGLLEGVIAPRAQGPGNGADRTLHPADATAATGQATPREDGLEVRLDATGVAWVAWSLDGLVADHYPFVHLALRQYPRDLSIALVWIGSDSEEPNVYTLETRPRDDVLLALREFQTWSGPQRSLILSFQGEPGATFTVSDVSLLAPAPLLELRALWDDWSGFTNWRRSAVNSHSGVTRVSPLYPAPAVAVLLVLSLAACVLISLMRRGPLLPWRALALVFLGCWILLDLRWQAGLLSQLGETRAKFAGLSTEQKRAVGPDARLYDFVRRARDLLQSPDARVFVASSDDYLGLRAAYYLLPHNTFFEMRDQPLPRRRFLRSGDYILIVHPSHTRLLHRHGLVETEGGRVPVQPLLREQGNSLSRVR